MLKEIILRLVEEAKGIEEIEERTAELVFELGRAMLKAFFEHLDQELMGKREKGLRHVGMRERAVLTRFGMIKVKRRYYRDREGKHRFLLDEALGWEKGCLAATPAVEAEALEMCSETSFRKAKKHLSFFLSSEVSHSLLHRRTQMRGAERAEEKRARAEELFLLGALPKSAGRRTGRLFLEADGCMISLQREKGKRRHELKAGISYEGWERASGGRWRTRGKRAFLSAADGGTFLSEWSADLATIYDHSGVGEIIWSSDGAFWLRRGPDLFSLTHAQLSRFHLKRSLTRALGFSFQAQRLYSLACEGRGRKVMEALEGHLEKATDEGERERISEAIAYLSSLSSWLPDWRHVLPAQGEDRSPGAMEGNVDKLLADRFKKRGMSWRPHGADCMCQIIELRENGELSSFISQRKKADVKSVQAAMASLRREVRRNPEAWLRKNMPLLESRSGDPWVKDVLKALAGYDRIAC